MKNYLAFLLLLAFNNGCHTNKAVSDKRTNENVTTTSKNKSVVADHTGNGTSMTDAVVIKEKISESAIWIEQDAWLAEKYPGYVTIGSRSGNENQKLYNIHKIRTTDNAEFEVYFDVSIFYNGQ